MKTKTQAILDAIAARGWKEVPNIRSRKYRMFQAGPGRFYLVGKAGAVRLNTTPKVQGAMSVEKTAEKLAAEGGWSR